MHQLYPTLGGDDAIGKEYGLGVQENSVHGSCSPATAAREIGFLFSETEIGG